VAVTMSDVIQIGGYKLTKRRVFKMAPLQHHFELVGWTETTITIRF
jgi:phospho-N-acetylmuramoyl-pentapeptide-transferase